MHVQRRENARRWPALIRKLYNLKCKASRKKQSQFQKVSSACLASYRLGENTMVVGFFDPKLDYDISQHFTDKTTGSF